MSVPGVAVYYISPSIGVASSKTDPINVAADSMYSFIRHANSGSANYDAPDLMLYMLAYCDIYSCINFLQRCYGLAQLYAIGNRYLPDALLTASGLDPEDVRTNLAQFRYGINVIINKASALAVPNTMRIFLRRAMLYQNIYTEGPSIKDQLYMMVPNDFMRFELNATTKAGKLYHHPWMNYSVGSSLVVNHYARVSLRSVSSALAYANALLDSVIRDEDFGIMSGDILKAYGQNIIKLTSLPEYYPIVPLYDQWVLSQFQQARVPQRFITEYALSQSTSVTQNDLQGGLIIGDVEQDPNVGKGFLYSNTYYVGSTATTDDGKSRFYNYAIPQRYSIMNSDTSDVSPDQVIEMTRLMYGIGSRIIDKTVGGHKFINIYPVFSGSEICVRCSIISVPYAYRGATQQYNMLNYGYLDNETTGAFRKLGKYSDSYMSFHDDAANADFPATGVAQDLAMMGASSQFKHLLRTYLWANTDNTGNSGSPTLMTLDSPLGNYANITNIQLARLHEVAILNELNVPSIGKSNNWT